MRTRDLNPSEGLKLAEYALEDFLELKAPRALKKTKALKEVLFPKETNHFTLFAVEGFRLAEQLVLIESNPPNSVETLIFLSPKDGRIQVKSLRD